MSSMRDFLKTDLRYLRKKKMSSAHLILMIRQWLVLLEANLPMERTFSILKESGAHTYIRKVAEKLLVSTLEGNSLHESFQKTEAFEPIFLALIQTGENSGNLVPLLQRYIENLQTQEKIRKRVQTAMIYPIILTVVSIVVVTFLLIFVVPSFVTLFEGAEMQLPVFTRILLFVSAWLRSYGLIVLIGMILLLICLILFFRTEKGRIALYSLRRKIPIIGPLLRDVDTANLASLMALFYEGNTQLLSFFTMVHEGLIDPVQKRAMKQISQDIYEGHSIAYAFQREGSYAPIFSNMLAIGEESGELATVSSSIAAYLDLEVQIRLEKAVSTLEPLIILVLSFIVGFIVLAIATPMFNLVQIYE